VGYVGQDPAAGFVTDVVTDELAYTMESIGLPPDVMRRRVEDTLDLLGLAELRDRPLATLSGGQRQRVAIGSVLTAHPRVLVLDEPTSALDPPAAEEVLAALQRLVHDLGLTVLLAEHRLERVIQYADRIVYLPGGGKPATVDTPARVMAAAPIVPPVVALGRLAGWDPLPLSIRDARRLAGSMRERLAGLGTRRPAPALDEVAAEARGLVAGYAGTVALRGVDLVLRRGEVVALMGRNGAGKSTLLSCLVGLVRPRAGTVTVGGTAPHRQPPRELVRRIGLVPQDPTDLLYADTVAAECAQADADAATAARRGRPGTATRLPEQTPATTDTVTAECAQADADTARRGRAETAARLAEQAPAVPAAVAGAAERQSAEGTAIAAGLTARAHPGHAGAIGATRRLLDRLAPGIGDAVHPRDLSEGQRLALALAVVLATAPPVLLLDEPTRGLDYGAKARLAAVLTELAGRGHAVLLATHDVELAAEVADRTVVLADGEVVADGPTPDVVTQSPAFAPQVAKILAPQLWLTVTDVEGALRRA
jgi:energy-coupling factor transport system ATP-binding protein